MGTEAFDKLSSQPRAKRTGYEQVPLKNVHRVDRNVLCKDDSRRQRPRVVARSVKRSDLLENGP